MAEILVTNDLDVEGREEQRSPSSQDTSMVSVHPK